MALVQIRLCVPAVCSLCYTSGLVVPHDNAQHLAMIFFFTFIIVYLRHMFRNGFPYFSWKCTLTNNILSMFPICLSVRITRGKREHFQSLAVSYVRRDFRVGRLWLDWDGHVCFNVAKKGHTEQESSSIDIQLLSPLPEEQQKMRKNADNTAGLLVATSLRKRMTK